MILGYISVQFLDMERWIAETIESELFIYTKLANDTFLAHQVTYSSTNHIYTVEEEHKMQTPLSLTIES